MKTRTIILITITALVLLSIVVRETGLLNLSFYKSNNHLSATEDWKEIGTEGSKSKAQKIVKRDDLSILILQGKDTLYRNINKFAPIVVSIDTLSSGPLWFPLYKSTKYTAVVRTSLSEPGSDDPNHHGIARHLEGQVNWNGELSIIGICSNRTAKMLLHESIVSSITEKVIGKFSSLPEEFFSGRMKNSLAEQESVFNH